VLHEFTTLKMQIFHELNTELERNLNTTHGLRGHIRSLRWRSCQSFTCWLSNSVLGSEVACSRSNTLSRCWWVVQPATSLILHAEPTVCLVVELVGWVGSDLCFWDDSVVARAAAFAHEQWEKTKAQEPKPKLETKDNQKLLLNSRFLKSRSPLHAPVRLLL
jgi:hypothetical protein